jgi:sRNA-binding protein
MISVLRDSHDCVGFLRSARPRGFTAYDAAGQLIGLFQDKQAAIEAITALNSTGDCK